MTMSGGILRYIRIFVALLLPLAWLVWVVCKIVQHDSADHILMIANAVALFVAPAQWIAPPGFQKSKLFFGLGLVVIAAWAACFWHFGTAETRKAGLLVIGGLSALGLAIWLIERGYRRWKAIADPVTRLFIATVVATVTVVCSVLGTLYALSWASRSFGEGNTSAGWLVALIVNLPLLGFLALAAHSRRADTKE